MSNVGDTGSLETVLNSAFRIFLNSVDLQLLIAFTPFQVL